MFALPGDPRPCDTEPTAYATTEPETMAKAAAQCNSLCRQRLICLANTLHYEEISNERIAAVRGGLTPQQRSVTRLDRLA